MSSLAHSGLTPSIPTENAVLDLIQRLEKGGLSNETDVLVEVALFRLEPVACRPNSAGTKVIYTYADGREETCWARDWSMEPQRTEALNRLKASTVNSVGRSEATAPNPSSGAADHEGAGE